MLFFSFTVTVTDNVERGEYWQLCSFCLYMCTFIHVHTLALAHCKFPMPSTARFKSCPLNERYSLFSLVLFYSYCIEE